MYPEIYRAILHTTSLDTYLRDYWWWKHSQAQYFEDILLEEHRKKLIDRHHLKSSSEADAAFYQVVKPTEVSYKLSTAIFTLLSRGAFVISHVI